MATDEVMVVLRALERWAQDERQFCQFALARRKNGKPCREAFDDDAVSWCVEGKLEVLGDSLISMENAYFALAHTPTCRDKDPFDVNDGAGGLPAVRQMIAEAIAMRESANV